MAKQKPLAPKDRALADELYRLVLKYIKDSEPIYSDDLDSAMTRENDYHTILGKILDAHQPEPLTVKTFKVSPDAIKKIREALEDSCLSDEDKEAFEAALPDED